MAKAIMIAAKRRARVLGLSIWPIVISRAWTTLERKQPGWLIVVVIIIIAGNIMACVFV